TGRGEHEDVAVIACLGDPLIQVEPRRQLLDRVLLDRIDSAREWWPRAGQGRRQWQAELAGELGAVEEERSIGPGLLGSRGKEDGDVLDREGVLEGVERELERLATQGDLVLPGRALADPAVLAGAAERVHHAPAAVE